jgi:hypothetical protein
VNEWWKHFGEKCRNCESRRIQKRCARFKPRNNRRKRTREVLKASGPSNLEDRCQRSNPIKDLDTGETGVKTLPNSRKEKSRIDRNH